MPRKRFPRAVKPALIFAPLTPGIENPRPTVRTTPALSVRIAGDARLLVEENVTPAGVEAEAAARVGGYLQRHWPFHVLVGGGAHGEEVVRAHVRHHKLVAA